MLRPRLLHVATVDVSLVHLLLPQLIAFRKAGFDVFAASAPGHFVGELESAGIRHVSLRYANRSSGPFRDALALVEFWRVCRSLRPDIVHTHTPKPGVWGRIGARLAGVPRIVNTNHGLYATPTDPWVKRLLVYSAEGIAAYFSDAELLQSPEDYIVLRRLGIPARKLTVIGNGIDLVRFNPSLLDREVRARVRERWGVGPDTVVIGAVGRLVAEKGWRELIAAFSRIKASGRDVALIAIGPEEPDKRDGLAPEELLRAREVGIVVTGWEQAVEEAYAAMDIFCLPSWREGFPRSLMEASAMALPVVATDVRGCRQAVNDGVTGVLVPVRDIDALVAALDALVDDAGLRERLGSAGRELAMVEFDVRRQVAASIAAYARGSGADSANGEGR